MIYFYKFLFYKFRNLFLIEQEVGELKVIKEFKEFREFKKIP